MQFKKFLGIMLALCLLISCITMIVACDNGSSEVKTNKETTKPTEIQTDDPTEDPTEKPSEDNSEKPTVAPTEKPTVAPTEKPTETPTENKVEYTVTVVDEEGNGVSGVMVQVCIKDSTCLTPVKTDANGVAKFSLEERDDYQAKIFRAEGYEYDASYVDFGTKTSVELKVSTPDDGKVEYTVTVKDNKGNAVAGIMIQVCIKNSTCMTPVKTDANGVATFSLEERNDYQAKIFRAEGYEYDSNYVDFGAKTAVELVVKAVCTHDEEETIAAVAPTCTETGLTEGKRCMVCGEITVAQAVVESLGHSYDSAVTKPTCTEAGYTTYTCSVCADTYTSDEVLALGHDWIDANCTTAKTCFVCAATEGEALGHTEIVIAAVAPTCTEEGFTEGKYCSVCFDTLVEPEAIPATGHTESEIVAENTVDPTCVMDGSYEAVVYCIVCEAELSREAVAITAPGHVYETSKTDPTCTEIGYTTYVCSVCNATYTAEEVDELGHDYVAVVTEPTCTNDGYTTYTCSRCSDTYTSNETLAIGHSYTADCDADCNVCGEARDADAHTYDSDCDADCNACGYVREASEHLYDGDCDADCNVCGAKRKAGAHTYDNGFDATCKVCESVREYPALVASKFNIFSIGYEENAFEGFTGSSVKNVSVDAINAADGTLVLSNMFAGMQIGMSGFTGFDNTKIEQFAYYFDDDFDGRVNSDAGRASTAEKNVAGRRAATFDISVSTTGLSVGSHTVTFIVEFDDGRMAVLATWNITIKPVDIDMTKPVANVIIVSGQSNAYGASPITDAVKAQYGNKTYNNVYIHYNNINVVTHPVDATAGDQNGTWKTLFSNDGFEQYRLGIGAQSTTYLGPELGIVDYLCEQGYADETPLYIIKFTAAGTYLNGQWFPTDQTNSQLLAATNNFDTYGLVNDMGDYLYNLMADYIQDSLDVIAQDYTPQIRSFFWVQGESDAGVQSVANSYAKFEQRLVNSIRSDFVQYASDTGISFVNYAIAETPEGNINWVFSSTINQGKEDNCEYYYDPAEGMTEPGYPKSSALSNSVLVISDTLRSKGTAGDIEDGGPSTDFAHMCGEDMALLGRWMGQGMIFLEEVARSKG